MSSHIGVSCDSCLKTNFSNRRYKCLVCDNYDLCGACYDINAESANHLPHHPMQCILTKTAYELFYAGESIPHRTIVSLTCPYCSQAGLIPHTLLIHCLDKHAENKSSQMCPICVINPIRGHQIRFVSLADHLAREHDQGDHKEDFDPEDEEDEGLPLYVLVERLFLKEENRRQRLAQTLGRHDYHSHRRLVSRQTGSRGNIRGHPYGTIPRANIGSFRIPFETNLASDPYGTILFSQDPLFGIDYDSISQTPFFLTSSIPTGESVTNDQKKSNAKHRRPNPPQQPVILLEPPVSDYHLWQQTIPTISLDKPLENKYEHDPRSLLGKFLQSDSNNKPTYEEDHTAFLQSLFLSSLNISRNKQQLS